MGNPKQRKEGILRALPKRRRATWLIVARVARGERGIQKEFLA